MASLCDTIMRMSCAHKEGVMLSIAGNKKRTNVTLSADLLEQAKAFGINLSATFDKALGEAVKEKQRALFLEENQQAMDSCNAFTEKAGLFSQGRGVL
ncbi:type II toxin-antitoxin system CcdA family antitoxin [Rahnella perminowiae]|uniref:type II toxin-antitoxin system CcdA family antitoxin n=1 Tax=Rahnella perminowiae TaxID=2816244 RepID=UPI0036631E7E